MNKIANRIERYKVFFYYVSTFFISWGTLYIAVQPSGFPVTTDMMAVAGMVVLLGPALSSVFITMALYGKQGFIELLYRLMKWQVHIKWYFYAIFLAPLVTVLTIIILKLFDFHISPAILANEAPSSLVVLALMGGLTVGFMEELGWSGFAVPKILKKYSVFYTGLTVGLVWGAWHFLLFREKESFTNLTAFILLLVRLFAWLPAYRILMVWLYDKTESLFIMIIMHAALVATLMLIDPVITGTDLIVFISVRAAFLWLVVLFLLRKNHGGS